MLTQDEIDHVPPASVRYKAEPNLIPIIVLVGTIVGLFLIICGLANLGLLFR
mgnify:CR=1 FL=1